MLGNSSVFYPQIASHVVDLYNARSWVLRYLLSIALKMRRLVMVSLLI